MEMEPVELDGLPSAETPTTPPEQPTDDWRKRLAGTHRALSETIKERDRLRAENETLAAERDQLRTAADTARRDALRLEAMRRWPMATELLGSRAPVHDPVYLGQLESKLKGDDEPDRDFHVNPNNPRRRPYVPPKTVDSMSTDELEASLASMPNPYTGRAGW